MWKSNWLTMNALVLAGVLAVAQAAGASPQGQTQSGGSSANRPAASPSDMDDLKLTDQQKSQIKTMRQQEQDQLRALRADTSLTPQQKMQKARAIRQNTNSQISSALTPEQRQRWQQRRDIRADRRDLRQDRQDLRKDEKDLHQDKREIKEDEREHASGQELEKDRQDIREDRRDINQDKRDIGQDKRDIQKDRKDLRKDRRRARKVPSPPPGA